MPCWAQHVCPLTCSRICSFIRLILLQMPKSTLNSLSSSHLVELGPVVQHRRLLLNAHRRLRWCKDRRCTEVHSRTRREQIKGKKERIPSGEGGVTDATTISFFLIRALRFPSHFKGKKRAQVHCVLFLFRTELKTLSWC